MERIVSLVPSHTETLHDLGAAGMVVGRTRFCIHPRPWVDGLPTVGGTKDASLARILDLQPSLVVADRDENPKALVDALGAAGVEVVWSDIANPKDAAAFIVRLGDRIGLGEAARAWSARIERALETASEGAAHEDEAAGLPVFCPIWHAPWMTFDRTAYPHAMLHAAALRNVFADHPGPRYFEVDAAQVAAAGARYTLLPTEPFPFHRQRGRVDTTPLGLAGQPGHVRIIDGEALTWFGTRTANAIPELVSVRQALRRAPETKRIR